MQTPLEELEEFYQFAKQQLGNAATSASLDELYDEWRITHPTPEEFAENVAAIRASLEDMNRGERGRDADEVIAEIRTESWNRE